MLTFIGSLIALVVALLLLIALVYVVVRYSPNGHNIWHFLGILMLFGLGLAIAAFMSLISPMAHDLIVIGVCMALAVGWAVLYPGFGQKTLIVGLLAIIVIYGYSGYSALLFATGRSPLARVPQAANKATTQVEEPPPVFQDGGSSRVPGLRRDVPAPALPKPSPQATQPRTVPTPTETTAPLPEPRAIPVETPHQEPGTVASPSVASPRQEAPAASPSSERNSEEAPPAVVQSPSTSPAVSVPDGCYGMTPEGSLNCLVEDQQSP